MDLSGNDLDGCREESSRCTICALMWRRARRCRTEPPAKCRPTAPRHWTTQGRTRRPRTDPLRWTAQRVDAQMVDYMRAHRIEGSWPASERVLVLLDSAQGANAIVRRAQRMADRL